MKPEHYKAIIEEKMFYAGDHDHNGNRIYSNGEKMVVVGPCVYSGREYSASCTVEQYYKWRSGVYIHEAMPDVPKDEREFLKTGTSQDLFDGKPPLSIEERANQYTEIPNNEDYD